MFPSSGESRETPTLLGAVIEISSFYGVSLPSPKEGNRSSFRIIEFSGYLEFLTIDKVLKPSHSRVLYTIARVL
jgi:hypothetical protein